MCTQFGNTALSEALVNGLCKTLGEQLLYRGADANMPAYLMRDLNRLFMPNFPPLVRICGRGLQCEACMLLELGDARLVFPTGEATSKSENALLQALSHGFLQLSTEMVQTSLELSIAKDNSICDQNRLDDLILAMRGVRLALLTFHSTKFAVPRDAVEQWLERAAAHVGAAAGLAAGSLFSSEALFSAATTEEAGDSPGVREHFTDEVDNESDACQGSKSRSPLSSSSCTIQ